MAARTKAAGYHGVQNMKFVPKVDGTYTIAKKLDVLYAKNLSLTVKLEAKEQYGDNRLLFRVPKDDGYEGEIGSTAPDYEMEKTLGMALEGADGLIRTSMAYYTRGALYYEFSETDETGRDSVTKVWLYNVELGKGSENLTGDTNSVEFGEYKYPIRVYGDKVMNNDGTEEYRDERGVGRTTCMMVCRAGDAGYGTFGDSVPALKVAAAEGAGG